MERKLMGKHDVIIQQGDPSQHRSQGIVERLAEHWQIVCLVISTIKN